MEQNVELWDLYTRDRQSAGARIARGEALPAGCYHLVVHVWIRNRRGQWLISRRAANRPTFPLMWETVGGSVLAGEDSLDAALREAEEEVGVQLDMENCLFLGSTLREDKQDIRDEWVFVYEGEVDLTRAITDEVAETRWMTVEEIRALHEAGEFVPTLQYFFDDTMLGGAR